MKILFVTNSKDLTGGDSVALLNILGYLKKNGFKLFVTCPREGEFSRVLSLRSIPHCAIDNPLEIYPKIYTWKSLLKFPLDLFKMLKRRHQAYIKLSECVKEFKPSLIHTNVGAIHIGYMAAKKYGIPHIWHIREYQRKDFKMNPFPSMWVYRKRLHSKDNHCICITKDIFSYFGLNSEKDIVIYDGVINKKMLRPISSDKQNYILFVGRLQEAKGIKELIVAYNYYAGNGGKFNLYIVGDGLKNYKEECERLVDSSLKHRVSFLGPLSHERVFELMHSANVFVVPSRSEGFGFITAEAMFNGTIVIGKNTGGTKEQFDNGKELIGTEISLRYSDAGELPSKLLECEMFSLQEYANMAKLAQQVVCEMYDIETQSAKVGNFLSSIIMRY